MPSPAPKEGPRALLECPFCGAKEHERLELDGRLVVIFPCMFSPVLEAGLPDPKLREALAACATEGSGYFQHQCDRLHAFVMKGHGAVLPPSAAARGHEHS